MYTPYKRLVVLLSDLNDYATLADLKRDPDVLDVLVKTLAGGTC